MTQDTATHLALQAMMVAVKVASPFLIAGLVIGLLVSIFQAATQIQEQSLNQVPKMFAVAAVIFLILPWLMTMLVNYTLGLVREMGPTLARM